MANGSTVSSTAKRPVPVNPSDKNPGVKRVRPLELVANGNTAEKRHVVTAGGSGFHMPSMKEFKSQILHMQQRALREGQRIGRNR
jgi:hypothetical protein